MKLKIQYFLYILIVAVSFGSALAGQNDRQFTTILLPIMENSVIKGQGPDAANDLLWIQKKPEKDIRLHFDLSILSSGLTEADFKECTLRLVAQNVIFQPDNNRENTGGTRIRIKGRLAEKEAPFIIALSVLSEENQPITLNQKTSPEFRNAVYTAYSSDEKKEKKISLSLITDSPRASGLFYSSKRFGDSPSNIPRLVIEYTQKPSDLLETMNWSQHQQNPEHTGRNPWIPFNNPTGFSLETIPISEGTVADYPLIYQGNLYLVNKINGLNYLVALDFTGREFWRQKIGKGVVQRSPVISRNGIFYTVTEERIAGYDLNNSGYEYASYPKNKELPGKLSDYTDLTIGNDGSLFLALKEYDLNYIYGFTHDLKPFLKTGPFEQRVSTITISPDGRKIFAQTTKGGINIDITNPSEEQVFSLEYKNETSKEYYHIPVAGLSDEIMVFSDFSGNATKGNVWGYQYREKKRIWNSSGTLIPQPVLGSNDLIYYIQGGALQGHNFNKRGPSKINAGDTLNTTSNLVMDGANNIFFWDNGYLYGFNSEANPLFDKKDFTKHELDEKQKGKGPEQFIRLMLGPDGTLWANNKNGKAIYAFKPQYAESDLTLKQEDIKNQTVYRATGRLKVSGVTLEQGDNILLQGQKGISFSAGFTVKNGASLLCRTGF